MFNWFKNNKRSSWLEGLIAAEGYIQQGYVRVDRGFYAISLQSPDKHHWVYWGLWVKNGSDGVLDYLDYYENNLK
jgi:hypothetical protein